MKAALDPLDFTCPVYFIICWKTVWIVLYVLVETCVCVCTNVCVCMEGIPIHFSIILTAVSTRVRNHTVLSQCSRTKVMKDCCRLNHSECERGPRSKVSYLFIWFEQMLHTQICYLSTEKRLKSMLTRRANLSPFCPKQMIKKLWW